jgi:hypothetical protein
MAGLPSIVRLTPASRKLSQPICLDAGIARLDLGVGWQLARDTTVKTNTARVILDLSQASWDSRAIDLHLQSVTGKIDVIIPRGVSVQVVSMTGRVILHNLAPPVPAGPVLRVEAETKAGRIRFMHERAPRRWRKRRS